MASRFQAAFLGSRWLSSRLLRVKDHVHLATFAPTGAGKGVAVVLVNLLSYIISMAVVDVKGELFRLTAHHRKMQFRHRIFLFDPLGVTGSAGISDCFNPLDLIDESAPDFLDQCRALACLIVVRTDREDNPHWNDCAQIVICVLIVFVCAMERDHSKRNFNTIRTILSSRQRFAQAIKVMQQVDACQQVVAREGGKLSWFEGEELASVQTTVQRHMEFLDSPAIARHVSRSTFDIRMLLSGMATVYFCLPQDKLASLAGLMRMWIGMVLTVTQRQGSERNPVLWMLDEVGHIGHVDALEQAVTLGRGSGTRLWFIFQDHDQVRKCFGDNALTVLGNINTQQYFGLTSYATAEAVSNRVGEMTIRVASDGSNSGSSHQSGPRDGSSTRSSGSSITWSNAARKLYKPEEILSLEPDIALILHRHHPVMPAKLVKYYDAPEFRKNWLGSFGTGRQHGLGLAAVMLAAAALLLAVRLADVATHMPVPVAAQPRATGARPLPYLRPAPRPVNRSPYRRAQYHSLH